MQVDLGGEAEGQQPVRDRAGRGAHEQGERRGERRGQRAADGGVPDARGEQDGEVVGGQVVEQEGLPLLLG